MRSSHDVAALDGKTYVTMIVSTMAGNSRLPGDTYPSRAP